MDEDQETWLSRLVLWIGRGSYVATLILVAVAVLYVLVTATLYPWQWMPKPAD